MNKVPELQTLHGEQVMGTGSSSNLLSPPPQSSTGPSMHVPAALLILILSVPSTSMTLKEKHSISQEKENCFAELLHQAGVTSLSLTSLSARNC